MIQTNPIQRSRPLEIFLSVEVRQVFSRLKKEDLNCLPKELLAQTNKASFEIDFFKNRIVTCFRNEKKTIEVSKFLSIVAKKEPLIPEMSHLLNQKYAKAICPKMGYPNGVEALQKGIRELYIGRCILGLGKSMQDHGYNQDAHRLEFVRIANVIKGIEPVIFSPPII